MSLYTTNNNQFVKISRVLSTQLPPWSSLRTNFGSVLSASEMYCHYLKFNARDVCAVTRRKSINKPKLLHLETTANNASEGFWVICNAKFDALEKWQSKRHLRARRLLYNAPRRVEEHDLYGPTGVTCPRIRLENKHMQKVNRVHRIHSTDCIKQRGHMLPWLYYYS